ncbi:endospore germination permease [Paenibacillus sp. FSL H8-0034]|uniref:endospore germination permease n=1 Tax=Paenibacillus sp. FSL H8-0034 TaxID=2954671 RepID=UPI0030F8D686
MEATFSRRQILFMLLLSLGISNHVFIIPHLIQAAGRDSWFSILLGYVVLLGWSLILYLVLKSMRATTFKDWLKERIGKFGCWLVCGALVLYLLILGMLIIFDTTRNINIYLLPRTPNAVVVLSFVLISYSAARSGLKTIVYMSTVLLPIVWLLGIGISMLTLKSKDYGIMLPFFVEGIGPNLHGGVIVVGGSVELLVLLLLQHKMSKPISYGAMFVLLTLLVGLIAGPTLGSLSAFGPSEAGNLRFPAFEQWRLVMIGDYISHVDFLAVFQLMAGSVTRSALLLHLLSELIIGRYPKFRQIVLGCFTALVSIPSLMQISDITMQEMVHRYFYKFSFIFGITMLAALYVFSFIPKRKGGY